MSRWYRIYFTTKIINQQSSEFSVCYWVLAALPDAFWVFLMSPNATQWQDFASTDLDQVQTSVSSMIKPHRLSLNKASQPLHTRMRFVQFGQISLMRLGYGADVRIQPDELAGFYLIQLPQYGHASVRCGHETVESSPKIATVLNPNAEIDMVWHANNEQLMLKIDRLLIEQLAGAMEIDVPSSGLVFPVKLEGHRSTNWQLMLRYLLDCARNSDSVLQSPLLVSQLEQLATTTFLGVHAPSLPEKPRVQGKVLPKHIRLVESYLHEHADQVIRVDELAALAQISIRSLHAGFKEYCGISPMQYLRQIRLDRARADLLQATKSTVSVAEIALRWGFMHQGRFSAEYKQRFGETPSQSVLRLRS